MSLFYMYLIYIQPQHVLCKKETNPTREPRKTTQNGAIRPKTMQKNHTKPVSHPFQLQYQLHIQSKMIHRPFNPS